MLTRTRSSRAKGALWFAATLWVACHVALSGCARSAKMPDTAGIEPEGMVAQVSPRAPGPRMPDRPGIVVTALDGTRFEGTPMQIHVSEGARIAVQGFITAHARDGRTWSATFGLAAPEIRRGAVSLQRQPLAEGLGMVGLNDAADDLRDFDSGTLIFVLGGGHTVEGRTTTGPESGSATFSGRYVLGCWVYPQTLDQAVNGDGDGESRVQDVDFASPFCKPFADLR